MPRDVLSTEAVKRPHSKTDYSDQDVTDLAACVADPLFFMRTFMKVQHPMKGALPFIPYKFQERIITGIHEHRFTIILTARQMGKALALNTPLPTPNGWTTIGDVEVGDYLIGADGLPVRVIFATDVMTGHECYEIVFDNGETVTTDADHLWTVGCGTWRRHKTRREVLSTRDIIPLLAQAKKHRQPVFVDAASPIVGFTEDLPVPPYTLGVWLGDGDSACGRFCGHMADCDEMRSYVTADGFDMSAMKADKRNNVRYQTIYGLSRTLRVNGIKHNKHIPAVYLRASIDQRLELLRGLMDTDGYAAVNGSCEIVQVSARLTDDIFDLLCGLGIKARRRIKVVNGTDYHRVSFTTVNFEIFKLRRKLERSKRAQGHSQIRRIFFKDIRPTLSVPTRCIQVDSGDHLFLCGKTMVPTHNTTSASGYLLWKAMFTPDSTILVTANKYLQALEIMDKIRYGYENLPNFIRAGVTEYNKGSLVFDNGSRIIARATSADAGRGLAITLLYADELSFIMPGKQSEFWTSIQPGLSEGGSCIITSTPKNDEDQFAQIWRGAIQNVDEFGNLRPGGEGVNGFFPVIAPWWEHPDRDEQWAKPFRESLGEARFAQEFSCSFLTDDDILINPLTLSHLRPIDPIFYTGTIRWYAEPDPNKTYLFALDPSLGTQNDYAAIEVFQLPEMIQIAEWQNNSSAPRRQVAVMLEAMYALDGILRENPAQVGLPDIYWTFENNSIGEAILQIVEDTSEDRFPGSLVTERRRKGVQMKRVRKGLHTTTRGRLASLARLKSLIESGRMTIHSRNLLRELKNFVAVGSTFKAKPGEHDDLIMATSLVVRMVDVVLAWGTQSGDGDLREYIADDELGGEVYEEPMPVVI